MLVRMQPAHIIQSEANLNHATTHQCSSALNFLGGLRHSHPAEPWHNAEMHMGTALYRAATLPRSAQIG